MTRSDGRLWARLAANLAYAALNAAGGVLLRSLRMGALAFYYLLLSALRLYLLHGHRRPLGGRERWRRYRLGAALMLLLTFALAGIFYATTVKGYRADVPHTVLYAMAAYTFYAVISAIGGLVRARKSDDPLLLGGNALDFAAAVVSVYTLQAAMIPAFGGTGAFSAVMGVCVGAGAFLLLVGSSAAMLIQGTKQLRALDANSAPQ